MKRADVVVLVIDATEGATQQDFVLAEEELCKEGCALVLCCNKWDLVDKESLHDELILGRLAFKVASV